MARVTALTPTFCANSIYMLKLVYTMLISVKYSIALRGYRKNCINAQAYLDLEFFKKVAEHILNVFV